MSQPNGYPTLVGRVAGDGTFRAQSNASCGSTGSINIEAMGRLDLDAKTMSLTYVAGSTMAANVNDTPFGATDSKASRATLTLR